MCINEKNQCYENSNSLQSDVQILFNLNQNPSRRFYVHGNRQADSNIYVKMQRSRESPSSKT